MKAHRENNSYIIFLEIRKFILQKGWIFFFQCYWFLNNHPKAGKNALSLELSNYIPNENSS